ncbi:DUF4190 domain-containing protein [Streptomyces sp. NPDC001205]
MPWASELPPQPRNGLGTAALVIGAISTFVAFLPFLFWIAWILGIVGLVFGLVGLSNVRKGLATNRSSALGGTVLGGVSILLAVVGLIITATMVRSAVDEVRDSGRPSAPGLPAAPAEDPDDELLDSDLADPAPVRFGASHEYVGGVKVTVAPPTEFELSGRRLPGMHDGDRTFHIDLTIVNASSEPLNLDFAQPHVKDATGKDLGMLYSTRAGFKPFRGSLAPGATATAQYSYPVSADAAKELRVEVHPSILYDEAVWSGPVA